MFKMTVIGLFLFFAGSAIVNMYLATDTEPRRDVDQAYNAARKKHKDTIAADAALKKRTEAFTDAIDDHYARLLNAVNRRDVDTMFTEIELFREFKRIDFKKVAGYNKIVRLIELRRQDDSSMITEFEDLMTIGRKISTLGDESVEYKEQLAVLNEKEQEQRAADERRMQNKKEADERRERRKKEFIVLYGPSPETDPLDGSVACVKAYLDRAAHDPDSLKYVFWSKPYLDESEGWIVACEFRGKNSFGALVLNNNLFVINHNKVVAVK